MSNVAVSFAVERNPSNHLAWMNAILGLQRTLMAAERTAVTLIAFGFTVAQVFQNMKTVVPPQFEAPRHHPCGVKNPCLLTISGHGCAVA